MGLRADPPVECLLCSRRPLPAADAALYELVGENRPAKLSSRRKNGAFLKELECGEVGDLVVDVAVATEASGLGV